jgi:23S rRNA pseudouridine1911/1915/1917 synthase
MTGARLDRFLADLEEVGSRQDAQRLLEEHRVLVDGAPRHKSFRVLEGMTVELDVPDVAPAVLAPDAAVPHRVVHEDEDLLVVDKPAGVVTHPAPGAMEATLVHALLPHGIAGGEDPLRPGIVHRLDRDTSGLLVVAKAEETRAALAEALRRREVTRSYVGLVHGRPAARAGRIEAPIGRDPGHLTRMAVDGIGAREAVTHFTIAEALRRFTLLDVQLETGRTHQIRVHLAAIGHAVVGDPVYAPPAAERLGLARQFLHAARLAFPHPRTGERVEAESPLPDDLAGALERARAEG